MKIYHRSKDKILSKIGYYHDQKGIFNRYLREVQNWNYHLEKSKAAIIGGMEGKARNKVVVLGSGWLLDIPLEELAKSFQEVWLADVFHPPQIIKKASQFSNIRFIQDEFTGMAEQVYNSVKVYRKTKYKTPVRDFNSVLPFDLSSYDYIVSCNILDQLDTIITDFLKVNNIYSPEELEIIIHKIQKTHLDSLPRNKTILICDLEEILTDADEQIISKRPLVHVSLPTSILNSWIWKFDTQMSYHPSYSTLFNVGCFNL